MANCVPFPAKKRASWSWVKRMDSKQGNRWVNMAWNCRHIWDIERCINTVYTFTRKHLLRHNTAFTMNARFNCLISKNRTPYLQPLVWFHLHSVCDLHYVIKSRAWSGWSWYQELSTKMCSISEMRRDARFRQRDTKIVITFHHGFHQLTDTIGSLHIYRCNLHITYNKTVFKAYRG